MTLLARIVESKQSEIAHGDHGARPLPQSRRPVDVVATLRRGPKTPLRLLAEIKFKSPSAGELNQVLRPGVRAVAYARAGANVVSVLCDGPFFGGSFDHVAEARAALDAAGFGVPVLAKEFVLAEVQLDWARAHGADAVLLIARIVDAKSLRALVAGARARGLEPLVEVVDEAELATALEGGATLLGVNARDLDTLAVDAARTARVLAAIPPDCVAIHLSGLRTPADIRLLARSRADGALVGEALMRLADPEPFIRELVLAGSD
jgi:indole-3-glycerol phosphate synthase